MTLPDDLDHHLPADAVAAWPLVAEACPPTGVLMGGTALTVHLRHRLSRDLDVFTTEPFDSDELEAALVAGATFATTQKDEGTLNGILGITKVQFLHAAGQTPLQAPVQVARLDVGQVPDIMATKLKVIGDGGELRDYFDLLMIEEIEDYWQARQPEVLRHLDRYGF